MARMASSSDVEVDPLDELLPPAWAIGNGSLLLNAVDVGLLVLLEDLLRDEADV